MQAAARRPVCRKRTYKDQPSAVAFTKSWSSQFGRKAAQLENSNFTFSIIYRNFVVNNGHEKTNYPCFCSAFDEEPDIAPEIDYEPEIADAPEIDVEIGVLMLVMIGAEIAVAVGMLLVISPSNPVAHTFVLNINKKITIKIFLILFSFLKVLLFTCICIQTSFTFRLK